MLLLEKVTNVRWRDVDGSHCVVAGKLEKTGVPASVTRCYFKHWNDVEGIKRNIDCVDLLALIAYYFGNLQFTLIIHPFLVRVPPFDVRREIKLRFDMFNPTIPYTEASFILRHL